MNATISTEILDPQFVIDFNGTRYKLVPFEKSNASSSKKKSSAAQGLIKRGRGRPRKNASESTQQ